MSSPDFETAATRQTIDALFASAATGEVARVLDWWAPDGILDDVTLARRYAGHGEIGPYLEMYYRAFEDLEFTPARVLVEGPNAAVEWAESFHFTGSFAGLPADGRDLRVRALDVFEVRDGRVVRESGWYGDGWMIERLVAPDPAALPEPLPRGAGWYGRAASDSRPAVSSDETRAVIDRLFAAAATGDTERVLEWWANDGVLDDVTIARRFSGHAEMRAYLDEYYRAFPDITFAPSLLIVDGPWALVEWAESCHFVAPFDGIEPDGRPLQIRAVDLFEIGDGVVQHESSWYGDGWFRQRLESPDPSALPAPLPREESW